jgi:hypothetical protein
MFGAPPALRGTRRRGLRAEAPTHLSSGTSLRQLMSQTRPAELTGTATGGGRMGTWERRMVPELAAVQSARSHRPLLSPVVMSVSGAGRQLTIARWAGKWRCTGNPAVALTMRRGAAIVGESAL